MSQYNKPVQRILEPVNPAAGAEVSLTPTGGSGWLLRSLRFQLVTDATVATRAVSLAVSNGSREWFRARANGGQAASLTVVYGGYEGSSGGSAGTAVIGLDFPANGLWIPRGNTLSTITASIQAGDQFSVIGGYAIEMPSGPEWEIWPTYPYMAMWPPYPTEE